MLRTRRLHHCQRIEIDIDYSDHVSLGIETKVLVNFPKPKFAIIPVSLALALVRFSATVSLSSYRRLVHPHPKLTVL